MTVFSGNSWPKNTGLRDNVIVSALLFLKSKDKGQNFLNAQLTIQKKGMPFLIDEYPCKLRD